MSTMLEHARDISNVPLPDTRQLARFSSRDRQIGVA